MSEHVHRAHQHSALPAAADAQKVRYREVQCACGVRGRQRFELLRVRAVQDQPDYYTYEETDTEWEAGK